MTNQQLNQARIEENTDLYLMERCLDRASMIRHPHTSESLNSISTTLIAVAFYQELRQMRLPRKARIAKREQFDLKLHISNQYSAREVDKLLYLRDQLLEGTPRPRSNWDREHLERQKRIKAELKEINSACFVCRCSGSECVAHHKHYKNWKKETHEDIVLLCGKCHSMVHELGRAMRKMQEKGMQSE